MCEKTDIILPFTHFVELGGMSTDTRSTDRDFTGKWIGDGHGEALVSRYMVPHLDLPCYDIGYLDTLQIKNEAEGMIITLEPLAEIPTTMQLNSAIGPYEPALEQERRGNIADIRREFKIVPTGFDSGIAFDYNVRGLRATAIYIYVAQSYQIDVRISGTMIYHKSRIR